MALRCSICGKGPTAGKSISHSHKTTNRRFLPNIHRVKTLTGGAVRFANVCSRCIRSQKVTKAGPRQLVVA